MAAFELVGPFQPEGDQPQAIEELVDGLRQGRSPSNAHPWGQTYPDLSMGSDLSMRSDLN